VKIAPHGAAGLVAWPAKLRLAPLPSTPLSDAITTPLPPHPWPFQIACRWGDRKGRRGQSRLLIRLGKKKKSNLCL